MRNWKLTTALVPAIAALAMFATPALASEAVNKCSIEIDNVVYAKDTTCKVVVSKKGIVITSQTSHVYVIIQDIISGTDAEPTGRLGDGFWGTSDRSFDKLGVLTDEGACWVNWEESNSMQVKVCAWK